MCAGYFCAGRFDVGVGGAEGFVEGETDGLDGDVGGAGLFEEGSTWWVLEWCFVEDWVKERGVEERTGGFARERSRHRRWLS